MIIMMIAMLVSSAAAKLNTNTALPQAGSLSMPQQVAQMCMARQQGLLHSQRGRNMNFNNVLNWNKTRKMYQ